MVPFAFYNTQKCQLEHLNFLVNIHQSVLELQFYLFQLVEILVHGAEVCIDFASDAPVAEDVVEGNI